MKASPSSSSSPITERKMTRLTRSSTSSPRTRSSNASSGTRSSNSSPRTRSSTSHRVRAQASPALLARHRVLYPITASLGFRGTKVQNRRDVHRATADELHFRSPMPGPDVVKPTDWEGHDLTGPILVLGTKRFVRTALICLATLTHNSAGDARPATGAPAR